MRQNGEIVIFNELLARESAATKEIEMKNKLCDGIKMTGSENEAARMTSQLRPYTNDYEAVCQ